MSVNNLFDHLSLDLLQNPKPKSKCRKTMVMNRARQPPVDLRSIHRKTNRSSIKMSSATPKILRTALRTAIKPRFALRQASTSTNSNNAPSSTSSGDLLLDILPARIQPLVSKSSAKRLLLPQSSKIPTTSSQSGNTLPPSNAPQHVHINHPTRLFQPPSGQLRAELLGGYTEVQNKEAVLSTLTGMSTDEIRGLNRYTVILKRVVNMTKKGKMWVHPSPGTALP